MINLLLFLFFIACLGMVGAWIAENPGDVTIHWFDYRIDTSFAFLVLAALVAGFTLIFIALLIRRLIAAPKDYAQSRNLRQTRKGMAELTYSVAALAATDVEGAAAHTRKAEKLLGRTPLVLLLSAQIARSQGDDARTRTLLEQMLEHDETEYLAARSLSDAASKQQLFPRALELAQRAQRVNPREKSSIASVIGLHVRLQQWQEAQHAISKGIRRGQLSRNAARHYRGIIHLQQGEELLQSGHTETAARAATQAYKEIPGFAPAIALLARAYNSNGQRPKAIRLLLQSYKRTPHPQIAEGLRMLIAQEPKEKQQKLLKKLPPLPTEAIDAAWVCKDCGHPSVRWNAHCPSCGAFDSEEWKQRELKFVG